MEKRELGNFFDPKTIAVIGASDDPKKVGYILMKNLLKFQGEIIPVNIKHAKVFGINALPSVKNYPKKIDLAIIAVPSTIVKQVLEECGEKEIKDVIVISAGFSEVGNTEPEKEIVEIAKKYKINLLGPNCFGVANPYLNFDTTFANSSAVKGDVAFISQSGALWSYLSDMSFSKKGLGFSGFVSLGNMADLNFSDFIEYFSNDANTKKIVLYIERLKEGKRFIEVCKKCQKPIIAIKAGKTKVGSEATVSHTGSLATDFEIYKGAFRQAGIKMKSSLAEIFGLPKESFEFPDKKKIKIITNAGGAGALISDYLVEKSFDVEPPEDLIGTALAEDYKNALTRMKDRDENIIVILTPQSMSEPKETATEIVNFAKEYNKKVIAVFLGDYSVKEAKRILEENKIKCITNI